MITLRPSLFIRPARAGDRDAVLAFATATWSWGDYLAEVWDRWLADEMGLLAVGEADGRVVGVDKLTLLTPTEAFFEGLRIDPAYRGRGYAQAFQNYMLAEAARRGARTVRLLTAHDNSAIHHMAARDGLVQGPSVVPWHAPAANPLPAAPAVPLSPGPAADAAWADLPNGLLWSLLGGRVAHDWHIQAWTADLWASWVIAGSVWATPPGLVVLAPAQLYANPALVWLHPHGGQPDHLTALAQAARRLLTPGTTFDALLPADSELTAALTAAGWAGDSSDALVLFEKAL